MAPIGIRSRAVEPDSSRIRLGPLEKIYLIWMVGGSCDGCTVSVTGAVHPRVEHLLAGIIPGLPRVELIHTVVSTEVRPGVDPQPLHGRARRARRPLRHHLGGLDHGRVHRR